jgi:hypothetical protein
MATVSDDKIPNPSDPHPFTPAPGSPAEYAFGYLLSANVEDRTTAWQLLNLWEEVNVELSAADRSGILDRFPTTAHGGLKTPPACPAWCRTDHTEDDPAVRYCESGHVHIPSDVQDHYTVNVLRVFDRVSGETTEPQVVIGDGHFTAANALKLAAAALNAVDVIEGHCTEFGGAK